MSFLSQIKNAIEDISSLQIATLYGSAMTLDSGIDQALKAELEKKIADQITAVNVARSSWLAATELPERWDAHREYRAAKARLSELREEYHGVSPIDIFERAQLAMGHAKTAGYTRLQLAGDSTNYYDAELTAEQTFLIDAHKASVESAIAARQKLVDTAATLLKLGQPI